MSEWLRNKCLIKAKEITKTLTLREKIGQITQQVPGWECFEKIDGEFVLTDKFKNWIKEYGGVGAIEGLIRSGHWVKKFYYNGIKVEDRVHIANMVQKYIMDNTRAQIPAMIQIEAPPWGVCSGRNRYEVEKSEVDILVGGNPYNLLHTTVTTYGEK